MNTSVQVASVAANAIAVISAMALIGRLAWKRMTVLVAKTVSAPLRNLQTTVDELNADILAVKEDSTRANERLDRHLESHGHV